MYLVLIKLDVLIIRWIRFDRILFSDIIIPRIPWSASSFGHVYNGLGHFSGRFVCDRLQNMYWISFLTIYFCWSTCMHIQQINATCRTLFLPFINKGKKYLRFLYCYTKIKTIFEMGFVITESFQVFYFFLDFINLRNIDIKILE